MTRAGRSTSTATPPCSVRPADGRDRHQHQERVDRNKHPLRDHAETHPLARQGIELTPDGGGEISAQIGEADLDRANYEIGERVLVTWNPAFASPLTPRTAATVASPELVA